MIYVYQLNDSTYSLIPYEIAYRAQLLPGDYVKVEITNMGGMLVTKTNRQTFEFYKERAEISARSQKFNATSDF